MNKFANWLVEKSWLASFVHSIENDLTTAETDIHNAELRLKVLEDRVLKLEPIQDDEAPRPTLVK